MTDEEKSDSELALSGPGGLGFRAKNYRVMDLVCLLTAAGVIAVAYYNRSYAAEYEKTAKAMEQNSEKIIQQLKENSDKNTEIQKQQTEVLRRLVDAMKESNCLSDPALKNRADAREICKRLNRNGGRDDR